jgi:hypothetical protein
MLRFKLRAGLIALTAVAALVVPASASATNVTDWELGQQGSPPSSTANAAPYANAPTILMDPYRQYTAPGYDEAESVVYGHETWGVDLTWTEPLSSGAALLSEYQWEFIRQPGNYDTPQVAATDHVALYNTVNGQYLAWACHAGFGSGCIGPTENYGINLYYSSTPQYQWQVAKGGDTAAPDLADLYNDVEQAYLIEHSQTFGVDLGWIHAPFETGPDYIPPTVTRTLSVSATTLNEAPSMPAQP